MRTLRRHDDKVPRHRASVGARWIGAVAAHPWYLALPAAGVVALAGGLILLPGHRVPPTVRGCGLVTCTSRRTTAAATGESGTSLRGARQAPARASVAPAQPGGTIIATPSPSPSPIAPHHGQARGIAHRRHEVK